MITQKGMVLMAILPLPPSTNDLHEPVVRRKKAESIFEEDRVYAAKRTNTEVIRYEYRLKNLLNVPQKPWRAWQDRALIKEAQGNAAMCLDLELFLYFKNNASDADNRGKALQDMLCRYLDINDRRIANPAYHKRVHKNVVPCVVAMLRITEKPDLWAEQAELDIMLSNLLGEKDASLEKDAIIFS